ncbi:rna helicase [Holotrichia oblita]|uniref:Rna helicase n=1 Tax=Holotrichia oblita TaxID=644536 RepID=A0ACB9TRD0_HOLOL|nr:rna helicase [Holotrichia oblita]
MWKPVHINEFDKSLEGLISIEECSDYNEDLLSKPLKFSLLLNKQSKHIKKNKSKNKKTRAKPLHERNDTKSILDISPSKQGFTNGANFTNNQILHEEEVNLEAWANLPLQQPLLKALASLKFQKPTIIQSSTLPAAILGKRDILGAAETGSGKTLAFGLPILHGILESKVKSLSNGNDDKRPLYALILTPTRELAMQVTQHLKKLAKYTDIKISVVVGGLAVEKQLRLLSKGPEIVVATPGRLWELIEENNEHLTQINDIKYLAIDETDRMLEKGHFQELQKILEMVNDDSNNKGKRQNFVFSATLTLVHELPKYILMKRKMKFNSRITNLTASQKLQKIAEALNIKNPKVVDLSQGKGMPTTLTECKITCTAQEKDYYTYYFIVKHPGRTLIFCNSIGCVRRLVTILSLLNCNVVALHSSLHQRQRLKNLDKFKGNDNCILIATDVAARGLDISNIQHVIHYQTPRTSESYVHRSGRTARASNEGITVLLVEPDEIQQYLRLCRTLGKTEDLPLFPIQENYLDAVKKRVNLAREIDKLEFKVKKSNSSTGWLQKAAEEMDIILDDDLQKDPDEYDDSNNQKKAATVKRKLLNALLEKPIFPRSFSGKYPLSFEDPEVLLNQGAREENAVEVMRNAIENNAVKHTIKTKRLFKSKIPKSDDINLNSFLKQKNSKSKPNFKNGNNRKRKNRKR